MRRAVVISVLVHLLILVSLVELRLLPNDMLQNISRASPLSVSFRVLGEMGNRDAAHKGGLLAAEMSPASGVAVQTSMLATPPEQKARSGEKTRKARGESPSSSPVEVAQNAALLPADMEREYRINLAREAHRSRYYPAEIMAKGREGIVRMNILYWSRLGRPTVVLEQSSGYRELDQEALKTLALAIGKVSLPPGAQSINFRMQYALEYRLAD